MPLLSDIHGSFSACSERVCGILDPLTWGSDSGEWYIGGAAGLSNLCSAKLLVRLKISREVPLLMVKIYMDVKRALSHTNSTSAVPCALFLPHL
jgi:hypothetical protein